LFDSKVGEKFSSQAFLFAVKFSLLLKMKRRIMKKRNEKEKHYFLGRKEICSGRLIRKMRLMKF